MAKYLLAERTLTGCDTVSYLFGIGKATALKALMGGNHLNVLGQLGADEDNLMSEVTAFIAACYDSNIKKNQLKDHLCSEIEDHCLQRMMPLFSMYIALSIKS